MPSELQHQETTSRNYRIVKPVTILYATREGHTKRVAERVAADLRDRGFYVEVRDVRGGATDIDLTGYCSVILAASVHAGKHEPEMVKFIKEHRAELDRMTTAFLSVT